MVTCMEKITEYEFNGFKATVITPENPNGKWVWKTEFLYAFDQAERALLDRGTPACIIPSAICTAVTGR